MKENLNKIKELVATTELANIELAFELIKGQGLDLNELLKGYRILLKMEADETLTAQRIADAKYVLMLDLSKLGLKELPKEIACFSELNSIDLSDNQLSNLPASIAHLSKLQAIRLNNNRFPQIPEILYQLSDLRQLYLNYNPIKRLSPKLSKLKALSQIGLRGCSLSDFPKELCTAAASYFQLDLGENKLKTIPEEIGQLEYLHYLHLDDNLLTALPESIAKLRNLQELDISNNPLLQTLPPNLNNLKSLANVYLAKTPINNIRKVQEELPWTEFWV